MIGGRIDSSKECGGRLIQKRTCEMTDSGENKRRNRVERFENERQNTRNTGQASMSPGRRRGTIIGGAQTMIETGQNIERIPRKMGTGIEHNGNSGIGNMIGMTRNRPRRRAA